MKKMNEIFINIKKNMFLILLTLLTPIILLFFTDELLLSVISYIVINIIIGFLWELKIESIKIDLKKEILDFDEEYYEHYYSYFKKQIEAIVGIVILSLVVANTIIKKYALHELMEIYIIKFAFLFFFLIISLIIFGTILEKNNIVKEITIRKKNWSKSFYEIDWKKKYLNLRFIDNNQGSVEKSKILKANHIPSKLYRYRSLNKFSIDEVERQYLHLVQPSNFNDLLDSKSKLEFKKLISDDQNKETYIEMYSKIWTKEKMQSIFEKNNWFDCLIDEVFKQFKDKDAFNYSINNLERIINEQRELANDDIIKCCCFSETKDNLAMWAHYAQGNEGICIEYETKMMGKELDNIHPIIYQNELPNITEVLKEDKEKKSDFLTWQVLQKLDDWSYEKEWRYVTYDVISKKYINHSFRYITAIYFGIKVNDVLKNVFIRMILRENLNIDLYDMIIKNNHIQFELIKL